MITLDRLINVLGGYGARWQAGTADRSTELRSVVLPEVVDGHPMPGDVLLAVGASTQAEALDWASSAGAVVVLTRVAERPARDPGDVAVVVIDSAMSWSELAAVVYGLVLEGRETESGRGPTDLFALADSLSGAVGGAVVIEDRSSRVLAFSRGQQDADPARAATILARQAPAELRARLQTRGVFDHLTASDEPLFVPADDDAGLTGRMVVAVRAGRELLGSVWVATARALTGQRRRALADGAHTVALHLLRSRASADLERQVESELVIRLLEAPADSATLASRLGLPPTALRVIALRAQDNGERHAALLQTFELATAGFGWSRPSRSALADTTVYTVLAADEAAVARAWVSALITALPRQLTVQAGISAPATATDLAAARREADECLALHEGTGVTDPPAYDESWNAVVLQRLKTAADAGRRPHRGAVAELRAHDAAHGTAYVATLRAWLQERGDPGRTAARLGIHENTVRYRVRRMADLTDLRLDDADKRFAMMIELAVRD
ncbi:helix-turn-helix domain-containing protein [Mycolicibacterium rufum]|uniref:Helix-turn-helix domain-containing protein n=1 Tax=Mycolicibacterium rufum TaxID=318424 RepID=A0A9X2YHZ0_9MYCO|nr:PucR family transcriptional regulator [Mycolicibacterium rufum]KGI69619.1 PucR family transcriptional regulator [Mycolicibacterium rufum]MCV7073849.1 helix-turn-helix domain-containing protein [Mycolicibacterium rufum]ULP35852.1 helix-turn-helix domain-containing protein [Mycolicibacterium rufum]